MYAFQDCRISYYSYIYYRIINWLVAFWMLVKEAPNIRCGLILPISPIYIYCCIQVRITYTYMEREREVGLTIIHNLLSKLISSVRLLTNSRYGFHNILSFWSHCKYTTNWYIFAVDNDDDDDAAPCGIIRNT